MTLHSVHRLGTEGDGVPLGTASLADGSAGVELGPYRYTEEEYLVAGTADEWIYDRAGQPVPGRAGLDYTTRVLVRRPADIRDFSGIVVTEPLHPQHDIALAWRSFHPWIMREGAAWMAVTQDAHAAGSMATEYDPQRYGSLSIPVAGLRWEIVSDVLASLRTGHLAESAGTGSAECVVMSGWSATGSFCRVFLGDRFHERLRQVYGTRVVDGYLICISSGGAGAAGYPPLSDGVVPPLIDDPRRTIQGHDVPVIELLSELESETHAPCLRPDSDGRDDQYRLYQVAGTSHDSTGPENVLTNGEQYRRKGLPVDRVQISEMPADGRIDFIGRAVLDALVQWIAGGRTPPRAGRFTFAAEAHEHPSRIELRRDDLGNVLGGVRSPWIDVPAARYVPHSSPRPGPWAPSAWAPMATAEQAAAMKGCMFSFSPEELSRLYGSFEDYRGAFARSCERLASQGLLLPPEMQELIDAAERRRPLFQPTFERSN